MNPQDQNDVPHPEQPNTPYERAAPPQSQAPVLSPVPSPQPQSQSGQQFNTLFAPDAAPPSQPALSPAPAPKKRSLKALIVLVIIVLVLGALVAATLMSSKDNKKAATNNESAQNSSQASSKVPDDWKSIDTGLGFSVKAPAGWEATPPTESALGKLETNSVVLSAPDTADTLLYVIVSTQSLKDKPGQAAFEASLTEIDPATEAQLQEVGLRKEDVTISSDRVTIGDKKWFRVTTEAPDPTTGSNLYTSSLFLWQGDHAINLTIIQPSKEKLTSTTDSYMKPMAASVAVKN